MAAGQTGKLAQGEDQPDISKFRHQVFISHSSEDKSIADAVRSTLEEAGIRCWVAPRDVMAGRPYAGQLTEAIRTSQLALLILSRQSNRSKHVLREINQAAYFQIPLLTFRVEEVQTTDDLAYFLLVDQWLNAVPGPPEIHYPELRRQVRGLLFEAPRRESEPAEEPLSSQTFGNFRILRHSDGSLFKLGKGGMGVTWKAIDANLGRTVALKVVGADLLGSPQARIRFLREAQAAARINHPNVATVYQFGEEGDSYFYAMEFVEGEDLQRYVERCGPVAPSSALQIVFQVAAALEAANAQNLIHRDIKPANLMAVSDSADAIKIKLIDFGLAKATDSASIDATKLTRAQDFVGSPAFASPEQCEGGEMDTRSDIYSLGVALWFLVSGRFPFTGSVGQLLVAQMVKPPPFNELSELPAPVIELLKKMLAKKPEDRPQTPRQLQIEIERAKDRLAAGFQQQSETVILTPATQSVSPLSPPPGQAQPDSLPALSSPLFDSYFRFEIGTLINERYRITEEEQEGSGGRLFLVQDEATGSRELLRLGLKLLHPGICSDRSLLSLLENEIEVIRQCQHENLFRYERLEHSGGSGFILREWVDGFSFFDLLRWRGSCSAADLRSLLGSLAGTIDFVSSQGFGLVEISLRKIFVVPPKDLHPDSFASWAREDTPHWKDCSLRLNPLSITPLLFRHHAHRAQQTMVPRSQMLSLTQAQAGIQGTKGVRLFARLIYELLSGHSLQQRQSESRYSPLPQLNEAGNAVLRRGCSMTSEPVAYKTCTELWNALRQDLIGREGISTPRTAMSPQAVDESKGMAKTVRTLSRPELNKQREEPNKPGPGKLLWLLVAGAAVLIVAGVWLWISISSSPRPAPVVEPSPTATASIANVTPSASPTVAPSPTQGPSPEAVYLSRAKAEAERGDYQTAIADYAEAIRLNANNAEAYEARGRAFVGLHQYDKAAVDFTDAIRLKPDFAEAYEGRGRTHIGSQEIDSQEISGEDGLRALSDFSEAIRLKPNYAEAYEGRGRMHITSSKWSEDRDADAEENQKAASDFTEAIRRKPDYADAFWGRAYASFLLGKYDDSINDLTEVIRLKPDFAKAYDLRQASYSNSGRHDKAISDLTSLIRMQPNQAQWYYERASEYEKVNEYEEAARDYTQLIQKEPSDTNYHSYRAACYEKLNEFRKAIEDYSYVISKTPDSLAAYKSRAAVFLELKEYDNAISDYTAALRINSQDNEANEGLKKAQTLKQVANPPPPPVATPVNQESVANIRQSVEEFIFRHMMIYMNGNMPDMLNDYADTVDFYDVSSSASHETIRRDRQKMFDRWVHRNYLIQKDSLSVTLTNAAPPTTVLAEFNWQYSYVSGQGKLASGHSATQMRLIQVGQSWKIVSEKEAVYRNK